MRIAGTVSDGVRIWRVDLEVDPPNKSMSVGDLYNMVSPLFSASKRRDYLISSISLIPLFDEDIQDVTAVQWQIAVDAQKSPYGKKLAKSIISKMYKTAIKSGIKTENLTPYIDVTIPPAKSRLVIDGTMEQKMWDYYNNTQDNVIGCVLIMLYTGMRPCEMRDVTADRITDSVIIGTGHKTDKGRSRPIIIPNKIMEIVKSELHKNNGVLTSLSKDVFSRRFRKIRSELNLPPQLVPYCARHTYATRLAEAGVSPLIITDLMGHTNVNMSYHYTHIRIDAMRSAVDKIADIN